MRELHTPRNKWSDERIDDLRRLHAAGLSARQIAAEIGVSTRNSVVGKLHRLGLFKISKPKVARNYLPVQTRAPRTLAMAIGQTVSKQADGGIVEKIRFGTAARKAVADKNRRPKPRVAAPAEFLGITFMELVDGDCKFPRGEGAAITFCGQPALEGQPYCPGCYRIAYAPPPAHRGNSPAPARYAAGPGAGLRAFPA